MGGEGTVAAETIMQSVQPEKKEHLGPVLDQVNGYSVIDCEKCHFKHIIPIPTQRETAEYYATEYREKRPGYEKVLEEDLEWWELIHVKKYDMLEKLLPETGRSLLDVGCGLAFFMRVGKERGWEVTGLEPARASRDYAIREGFNVMKARLEDFRTEKKRDVIHAHEVLEHCVDPQRFVSRCHELLLPGGIACITVPNDYNPLQRALLKIGYKTWWVKPPEHINYFDVRSVTALLSSIGFKIKHTEMSFPMEVFLLMGDDYVGKPAHGRRCHRKRKQFDFNLSESGLGEKLKPYLAMMPELGIGREVTIYARKK